LKNGRPTGDVVVVDRDFRDSLEFLDDIEIKTTMPVFLKRDKSSTPLRRIIRQG
jgi:flagellar biosynthesis regulator FlbT